MTLYKEENGSTTIMTPEEETEFMASLFPSMTLLQVREETL